MSGIDDFLDHVTVLPPGEWDPKTRIEPPKTVPNKVLKSLRNDQSIVSNFFVKFYSGGSTRTRQSESYSNDD